jgi:hypothetical protein
MDMAHSREKWTKISRSTEGINRGEKVEKEQLVQI